MGHILRSNCVLNHIIEGKVKGWTEVTVGRRKRHKQPHDELKETRRCRELKEDE